MTDPTAQHESMSARPLLRVLGIVFGLAVVVGGTVGSGIMRAPGIVAQGISSPSMILLAWALGGGVALLSAMPLVEAGSSVPMAGGPYPIAERAFGPVVGFITGWLAWLSFMASAAFIAVVFGEYVHRLGFARGISTGLLASGLIIVVSIINWAGTRISGGSQSVGTGLKGAALLILVVVLFASPRAPLSAAPHIAGGAVTTFGAAVMAIRVIYQTYAGWDTAIYFSEEVQRPDRNIARATFWGLGGITVLYMLINAAVLHVLSPAQLAASTLAVGDAAKVSLGSAGDVAITAIGLISLAAITNLQIMAGSRVTYRMARDGALPPALAAVAAGGSPWVSVALIMIVSMLFAATGTYEGIIRIYAPWTIGPILIVCLSAIRLRIAEPDLPRPWRMPFYPWLAIGAALVQAALIVLVVGDDPVAGFWSTLMIVAPLPIYWFFTKTRRAKA